MKNTTLIIITLILNISFSQNDNLRNRYGNDTLSENPIYPIPAEMTFDEYQDMNRRLNVGLLLAAIPIPGTIHHYAGEKKNSKKYTLGRCWKYISYHWRCDVNERRWLEEITL